MYKLMQTFFILSSVLYCAAFEGDPKPTCADGNYIPVDYNISIHVTEPFELITEASVTITFTNSESLFANIFLDLSNSMAVHEISYTHPYLDFYYICDFSHRNDTLEIYMPWSLHANDTFFITITYSGEPNSGYYASTNRYGNPVIHTLNWPSNARAWLPCIDHPAFKATSNLLISVPLTMSVASNGILEAVDTLDDSATWHWICSDRICTYNICFSAAEYILFSAVSRSAVRILYFVYPEDSIRAIYDFARTPEIMDTFEAKFGAFPLAKYGIAQAPIGAAGMEHQSMTFIGDELIDGRRTYESVVAHELAHSWFGNSVGIADWRDFWLNEGLAEFSEFIYSESFFGSAAATSYRNATARAYMSSGENFSVFDPEEYLSYTCYNRAAMIFELIRFSMGDSVFFATLRDYATRFRQRTVTHDSLVSVFAPVFTENIELLLDQWVFAEGGVPDFENSYGCYHTSDSFLTVINVEQVNWFSPVDAYVLPVEIQLLTASSSISCTVLVNEDMEQFFFTTTDSVISVLFDPNVHFLRRIVWTTNIAQTAQNQMHHNISISPNPFNSVCKIDFPAECIIEIVDNTGKYVQMTKNIAKTGNSSSIIWDAHDMPSGVYNILATYNGTTHIIRAALVK